MRIGYPCINRTIGCTANTTFRLASYSEKNLFEKVANNLSCLKKILQWNAENGLLFFRVSSDIVPFASHPVCNVRWWELFRREFREAGDIVRRHRMRISMHPDQFVILNALRQSIVTSSVQELWYHAQVLDAMGLKEDAKVQIHIGGLYGDRQAALRRFAERHRRLPDGVRQRLVVENDHRLFGIEDCLSVHGETGIPVVFDVLHHQTMSGQESVRRAMREAMGTWNAHDGPPMVDYSVLEPGARPGTHAMHLDAASFKKFLRDTRGLDFDLMLEIKDKESSALAALKAVRRAKGRNGKKSTERIRGR